MTTQNDDRFCGIGCNQQAHVCCSFWSEPTSTASVLQDGRVSSLSTWSHGRFRLTNDSTRNKDDEKTSDEVDLDIAKALNQLSVQQRDAVYNDIHGTTNNARNEEDPNMTKQCLDEMDGHLQRFLSEETSRNNPLFPSALKVAMQNGPDYVCDQSFRIGFLRAEEWKTQQAADRMIRFFEVKRDIFGEDKLTKEITLDDLDEDDLICLEGGLCQWIPLQDRSGRQIVMTMPILKVQKTDINSLRTFYYMYMAVAKHGVETQRQGSVEIFYKIGTEKTSEMQTAKRVQRLRNSLPLKSAVLHLCTDSPSMRVIIKMGRPFMSAGYLSRIRIHCGDHVEVQYDLLSYGIPLGALPVTSKGQCSNTYHKIWLQRLRQIEQNSATTSFSNASATNAATTITAISTPLILQPRDTDVILGRGRSIDQHSGNINFRKYLQQPSVLKRYIDAPKFLKFEVAEPIRVSLQDDFNVRFLKVHADGIGWELADDEEINQKILRTCRRLIADRRQKK